MTDHEARVADLIERSRKLHRQPPGAGLDRPVDLPQTHQEAAQRLVSMATVHSAEYRKRELSVPRDGCDPDLTDFQVAFIKHLKSRGMPFFVHDLMRTKEQQDALFNRGVSKAKFGQSAHNYGMAADIVHYGRFWNLTKKEWAVVGLIGKEIARRRGIKMTWGGDWNFYDPAHWELADWKERAGIEKPVNDPSFSAAFAAARKAGKQVFRWNGNWYSTAVK